MAKAVAKSKKAAVKSIAKSKPSAPAKAAAAPSARKALKKAPAKPVAKVAAKMGYRGPGMVWYHMKKFGIPYPREWSLRPHLALARQQRIPEVVIPTTIGRRWVAGLVQGETCIQSLYREITGTTYLELDTAMVDPAPICKLSEYFQLPAPGKAIKNHDWRPQWRKNAQGLRALRILKEITPFLLGEKLREATKALDFFSPFGYHRGCFRNGDIWPRDEFPLRSKRRGSIGHTRPSSPAHSSKATASRR